MSARIIELTIGGGGGGDGGDGGDGGEVEVVVWW